MKIHIVTDGCYSDYHIVAAYSNEEVAEAHRLRLSEGDITTLEVDTPPPYPPGMFGFRVTMMRDGQANVTKAGIDAISEVAYAQYNFGTHPLTKCEPITFHVWATDEQHAVKIVNERRAQMIAEGSWDKLLQ